MPHDSVARQTAAGPRTVIRERPAVRHVAKPLHATPSSAPRSVSEAAAVAGDYPLRPAKGLHTWVDLYDYGGTKGPRAARRLVDRAARHHVQSLWVETSRYNTTDIAYPRALGAIVDRARARGIKLVAWTLPLFRSVAADEDKARAAMAFRSPRGHRFAALGLDIEVDWGAPAERRSERMLRLARHLEAGLATPLYGIVPPPIGFAKHPEYWPEFPWPRLARHVDALATMGYWSYSSAPAGRYTRHVLTQTRALVGDPAYPIVVAGGLAESTSRRGAASFCREALGGSAIGAGLYDLDSTPRALWPSLQDCRAVGH
jgi:hypothetical protein